MYFFTYFWGNIGGGIKKVIKIKQVNLRKQSAKNRASQSEAKFGDMVSVDFVIDNLITFQPLSK
jgi:hypothetical protein